MNANRNKKFLNLIDFNSLRVRILGSFIFFVVILFVLIWLMQVFFLSAFYENMKINYTKNIGIKLQNSYSSWSQKTLIAEVENMVKRDDLQIIIESEDPSLSFSSKPLIVFSNVTSQINFGQDQLINGDSSVSFIVSNPNNDESVFIYGIPLSKDPFTTAYLVSPLYPRSSTISIFEDQLFIIFTASIAFAALFAAFLARRLSKPVDELKAAAYLLAKGDYGVEINSTASYTELKDLASSLKSTSEQLHKSMNVQKDLMANVSHDLKTPLTMIVSYSEMIRDISGDNPQKRDAHLKIIMDEANRLDKLVSDMLTLTNIQAHPLTLSMRHFNPRRLIDGILRTYEIFVSEMDYKLIINCKNDLSVLGDIDKIKQVLNNLLTNAFKFSKVNKVIIINVKRKEDKVRFEIIDHGIGIKEEDIPKVWERYYRASSNHTRTPSGSGLGLSITKEILILHKANYGIESTVGKGSKFWFELESSKTNR